MDVQLQETLSPELVLVDAESAASAREALELPEDTLDRILLQRHYPQETQTDGPPVADEATEALRRITELADVSPPTPRRSYRLPKLLGAFATWTTVGVIVAETHVFG